MTCYNRIVCGCQLREYSNDFDWKEFCIGSLDFIKGRVVFEFIVQLLLINSLYETLENMIWLQLFHWIRQLHPVAPLRLLGSSRFHGDFT